MASESKGEKMLLVAKRKQKCLVGALVLILLLLTACQSTQILDDSKFGMITSDGMYKLEDTDIFDRIEEKYGIANTTVSATEIKHANREYGKVNYTYDTTYEEGAKGGVIFYKIVETEAYPHGLICLYLENDENGIVSETVKLDFIHNYTADMHASYTRTLTSPTKKNRCYAIFKDNYLVNIEVSEHTQDTVMDEDGLYYEESITVYDINENMNEVFAITREFDLDGQRETRNCQIKSDDEWIIYAYGYGKYEAEQAHFVTTQQEFCDKTNILLHDIGLTEISIINSSWNTRAEGISFQEEDFSNQMVKIDYETSDAVIDSNGDEVTNIIMTVNSEEELFASTGNIEEVDDNPTYYGDQTEEIEETVAALPSNIPANVDSSTLQELTEFNIDGYWYSTDYKYVYHIYTQTPDNGFGTLYFANLEGQKEPKHGQVKQTSAYSVILKAMESNEFSPEVFASNNQLVSEEITLIRVPDSTVYNLRGYWSDGVVTYSFDSDGNYHVKDEDESYWGFYFIINENTIVMNRGGRDGRLKSYKYKIDGNELTLYDSLVLKRQ